VSLYEDVRNLESTNDEKTFELSNMKKQLEEYSFVMPGNNLGKPE
jgi:hypothetical protein